MKKKDAEKLTELVKEQKKERRALNKAIREKCDELGWDVWSTYTDGRRVKFARNGWDPKSEVKARIHLAVEQLLRENGVEAKVEWSYSESWRGPYPTLILRYPK